MGADIKTMSDLEIHNEIVRAESEFDATILSQGAPAAILWWDKEWRDRFPALCAEAQDRKKHSSPAVVRLRFLGGETGRRLDAACGEALGWRVDHDEWWNWHEGPRYDPPGDAWCIRKDARKDLPCNEALPHFTAETFEVALREVAHD